MTIKTELANGNYEIFESNGYNVSTVKDMHPMIVAISVYNNGKRIFKKSRFCKWWYKHITFKTEKVQNLLKEIEAQRSRKETN